MTASEPRAAPGDDGFAALYPFPLDAFQGAAIASVAAGRGVLVAAPTGAGKTVVGEYAVHRALQQGRKCFYTTPIKALSNQKYGDLCARYGTDTIGLLTGDNAINGSAPIVVMTTEVLRNMLYTGSGAMGGLGYVVMDEVHYLADRFRGAVWEEVIIHLPDAVQLVSLSATVSNAEEFGAWLRTVRGATDIVVEETRPVPLWQHVMVGPRLYDLFVGHDGTPVLNPDLRRVVRESRRSPGVSYGAHRYGRRGRSGPGTAVYTPRRAEVVERLDRAGLLPAITFIFSRAGCDAAVEQCSYSGVRLLSPAERAVVERRARERCAGIAPADLAVLGYDRFLDGLRNGLAAHHAGLLPVFKELVEELFAEGLVRAVFATETLALGINMPARTVVLERLTKWNGETHADLTPGEYTQLTGRAGRRGIDVEGHAVVLWQPDLDLATVGGLASTRTYPLNSSFRPSYNMAVNLIRQYGRGRARELLGQSFAQFQADRSVVALNRRQQRIERELGAARDRVMCDRGDLAEYVAIRAEVSAAEKAAATARGAGVRAAAVRTLAGLRRGDVVEVVLGRRRVQAVVVDTGTDGGADGPRPEVVTADRRARRLTIDDARSGLQTLGSMPVPRGFNARSPAHRRDLAVSLRSRRFAGRDAGSPQRGRDGGVPRAPVPAVATELRRRLRDHPCHRCPDRDEHLRWADRTTALTSESAGLKRAAARRTGGVAAAFDSICGLLVERGFLDAAADGFVVTARGQRLGRLYTELDLVAAECLESGVWAGLDAPALAACVSALVYEGRRPDDATPPRMPPGGADSALRDTERVWTELHAVERRHRVDPMREPDLGIAWAAYAWTAGESLESVLLGTDLAPGDFVRWMRQLIDLLGQVADAADHEDAAGVRAAARRAVRGIHRGVVAYSSVS